MLQVRASVDIDFMTEFGVSLRIANYQLIPDDTVRLPDRFLQEVTSCRQLERTYLTGSFAQHLQAIRVHYSNGH
jgi:hypothetical protein